MKRYRPVTTVELITPVTAKEWLDNYNEGNRPLNWHRIHKMADDMKAGKFPVMNDAISFDVNGRLWNGQNRLNAIVVSGCSIEMSVTRGTDPDCFLYADSGMKRSGGQSLQTMGYENATNLAALAGAVVRLNDGTLLSMHYHPVSPADLVDVVKENPVLVEIVKQALRVRGKKRIPWRPLSISLSIYMAHLAGWYEDYLIYLDRAATGANLQQGDPVLALRNRFMTDTPGGLPGMLAETAMLLKGFLWSIDGKKRQVLSYKDGEAFPVLPMKGGR